MVKIISQSTYHLIIFLSISASLLTSCSSRPKESSNNQSPRADEKTVDSTEESPTESVGFISSANDDFVIDHKFFKILYDSDSRLAKYVFYDLKAQDLNKSRFKRKDRFREDPLLAKKRLPTSRPSEYTGSGYDKGHLAPSADFSWNEEANDLTFVMSNMAPQKPSLNRDAWRRLEDKVRHWACGEKHISVITGPIDLVEHPRLKSGLAIPEQFFKIIIDQTPPRKFIAFIYNQDDKGDLLSKRSATLTQIENISKLSFKHFFIGFNQEERRSPASLHTWNEAKCD